MIDATTFFSFKESRAKSGYKSAWLVKMPNETMYSLIGATESVPYVFGDKETFEYNLLQSATIGQVEGKITLSPVDVSVLHHRDNAYRYEKLKGKTLDFMSINSEFVGYKFTGTIDYRPDTAEADINRATVTVTPMDADTTPIYNARDMIMPTLCFKSAIPETVKVGASVDLSVKGDVAGVSVSAKAIAAGTNAESVASTTDVDTGTITAVAMKKAGLYALTVSATGYASWTTTVYVEA